MHAMIIARPLHVFSGNISHVPRYQAKRIHAHAVGVMQYGLVALAMFSVSAVAGVVAGVVVGVFH
jgi:hypothetical protein